MKRILSLLTVLCLALTLAVPVLAEAPENLDDALAAVTLSVKEALDIDDDYTEFSGSWNDGLRPGWYLNWSDADRYLSVTCDADGTVTEVYGWNNANSRAGFFGFDAAFPALGEADARAAAEDWLARVTGQNESARIDRSSVELTKDGDYTFYGRILMNGLESPVTFNIRVGGEGVSSYSRSDSYKGYIGGVPAGTPAADEAGAAAALKDALALELYYVSDDSGEARLRYVPVGPYTVVDAQTGEAFDLDALYASFGSERYNDEMPAEAEASMAMDAGAGRGLTETELAAIDNYKDALDQEALDAALRALPYIGLEDFSLERCSYGQDIDTGRIEARLRYTADMDAEHLYGYSYDTYEEYTNWNDRLTVTKYITVDARTGALISLGTSYPVWEADRGAMDDDEVYDAFLSAAAPEMYAQSGRCLLAEVSYAGGASFARLHEGYFFPENYLYISLNPGTGTVDEYRYVWDEDTAFAPAAGLVDEDAALDAYAGALDVALGYTAWPEDIDWSDPIAYRYSDWGCTYVESLRLAYYYGNLGNVSGVDALTGAAVVTPPGGGFAYDDLAGNALREQIEALAEAGIGFAGGKFEPDRALTVGDAVRLLFQACGYEIDSWDDSVLRDEAAWMGFIPFASDWTPARTVTGGEFVRMLLGASRYGAAAELDGVWAPSFGNDGYAAVLSALGMPAVPAGTCTRADAAALLYGFMAR